MKPSLPNLRSRFATIFLVAIAANVAAASHPRLPPAVAKFLNCPVEPEIEGPARHAVPISGPGVPRHPNLSDLASDPRSQVLAAIALEYAETGDTSRAIAQIARMPDRKKGDRTRAEIVERLVKKDDIRLAGTLVPEIDDAVERNAALRTVAIGYAAASDFERALTVAGDIGDSHVSFREETRANVAFFLAKAGESDRAIALAKRIETQRTREWALGNVAIAIAKRGEVTAALAILEDFDGAIAIWAREEIALAFGEAGDFAAAREVAENLMESKRATVLGCLAALLWRSGRNAEAEALFAESVALARRVDLPYGRPRTSSVVARFAARVEQIEAAIETMRSAPQTTQQNFGWTPIATIAAEMGHFSQALRMVYLPEVEVVRSRVAGAVALQFARAGGGQNARTLWDLALQAAEGETPLERRDRSLWHLTRNLADAGEFAEAERVAALVSDRSQELQRQRSYARLGIVRALAREGDPEEVTRVAIAIADPNLRDDALNDAVGLLGDRGRLKAAEKTARAIGDPLRKAKALVKVGGYWLKNGREAKAEALFAEALTLLLSAAIITHV